jgi:hypothetical protein
LNEVRDVITTEPIPTTRQFHVALQPEHEPVQQDQQKRQQYQSIQRHREPVQQYQTIQHQVPVQQYQQDQHYQIVQPHQASVQQYQPDQNYQVPVQQYQPDEKYQSVERFRVTDQTSLPSEEQPQYDADDPERGEESQFTTRTLAANFNNAIPNVAKSSSTQLEVTTEVPVLTEEVESTTEALVPTTEAAPLMLTALPDLRTTTESSTVCEPFTSALGFRKTNPPGYNSNHLFMYALASYFFSVCLPLLPFSISRTIYLATEPLTH